MVLRKKVSEICTFLRRFTKFNFYCIISVAKEAKVGIPFAGRRVELPTKLSWSNSM
jgi:hypothetical protein